MQTPEADLIAGIVAKWKDEPSLSDIAGPYYGGAPEGVELPRCVLICLPATLRVTTGSSRIYDCTAQIRVWDKQPEGAATNATHVGDVFRDERLSLDGMVDTRKVSHRLIRSSLEKQDVEMSCVVVELLFVLQQSRR